MAFQGFTRETVDFMWGIRFNNEREWFMAHKEDYINTFLTPIKELGEQVYEAMHEALPDEPLILKVSRIYRDAPPSGLSWGRTTTALVWASGHRHRR